MVAQYRKVAVAKTVVEQSFDMQLGRVTKVFYTATRAFSATVMYFRLHTLFTEGTLERLREA